MGAICQGNSFLFQLFEKLVAISGDNIIYGRADNLNQMPDLLYKWITIGGEK
jgi:hypothetical protein